MKFTKTTTEQCADILSKSKSVAIFTHTRPDGDTLGSAVSLHLALKKIGVFSKVFCDSPLSDAMKKVGFDNYVTEEFNGNYDLFCAVDCGDVDRVGAYSAAFAQHSKTMTLDHHGGNFYSVFNCILPYSSTAQIIYEIITQTDAPLDKDIARFLYVGLCTDTGCFSHSNTDKDSFSFAAALMEYDVDVENISRLFFDDISFAQSRFIGERMNKMISFYDGKFVIIFAKAEDWKKYGLDVLACDGMVTSAINVESALVAAAVSEHCANSFKISMRGKKFDVQKICSAFGGGGHKFASGCQINGVFEDVVDKLVREVGFYL